MRSTFSHTQGSKLAARLIAVNAEESVVACRFQIDKLCLLHEGKKKVPYEGEGEGEGESKCQ
jgi:hypothetical protein